MTHRPPKFQPSDTRRVHDAQEAFRQLVRDAIIQAVSSGWREAEAALALADAADDYVLFLAERPHRHHSAANSN